MGTLHRTYTDNSEGIYWGFCRVGENPTIFKTACSIGYNPYYGNERKTVEPHLIASLGDDRRHQSSCGETLLGDFYDQSIRLSLLEYLRPELPFEGLEKLVAAIKKGWSFMFETLLAFIRGLFARSAVSYCSISW